MLWDRQSLRYRNGVIDAPGGGTPHGSGRIVLLVHGYNNDKADADQSYAALLANVATDVGAPAENIWRFYWPSYVERLTGRIVDDPTSVSSGRGAAGTESNALLSMPTYALQVLKAREVGATLGRYLRGVHATEALPTEIIFVAHSLGCRVVLEALRELLDSRAPDAESHRVPGVCLMAAAVPTFMIEGNARLGAAAMVPRASYVLHSKADLVLRLAFPPGQGAATAILKLTSPHDVDGEGRFPEAVGRHGNPTTTWVRRGDTGLGHSGYWAHRSAAPNVLRALRGGVVHETRTLAILQQVSWALPPAPELPDWQNRDTIARAQRRPLG
jgi:hypothetical protein